jgi:hypothetical protein
MSPLRRNIYPDEVTPGQLQTGVIPFTDDADDRFHCALEALAAVMQQITQMQYKKHLLQANQTKVLPGEQIILTLSNGYTLRSGGGKYELGAYVRICNEQGLEMACWSSEEVRDASEQVLGAIFGAILHPERFRDVVDDQFPAENTPGQDEKLAAKVLTWNGEWLSYSSSFDTHDPHGEGQTDAEGLIAAHLFDEYEASGLFEHTRWIIAFVVETFFQGSLSRTVRDILQLTQTLSEYLAAWQNQLASPNEGPNEEEAATAGRDTLLLTLRFLNPEWVKIDSDC